MLVVLRLALGWHFLYEGVWKLTHRDAFVAETEGFLASARGPAAKFFYRMVPDIDGHRRLEHDLEPVDAKKSDNNDGKEAKQPKLAERWADLTGTFVDYYRPAGGHDESSGLYKQFEKEAAKVCQRHVRGLDEFLKENGDKITAHFASLHRYDEQLKSDPTTDFMRQRQWDQMQDYRKEAKGWMADLDAREKALKADLADLLSKERKKEADFSPLAAGHDPAGPFAPPDNPLKWARMEQLSLLLACALHGHRLVPDAGPFHPPLGPRRRGLHALHRAQPSILSGRLSARRAAVGPRLAGE